MIYGVMLAQTGRHWIIPRREKTATMRKMMTVISWRMMPTQIAILMASSPEFVGEFWLG
jgi:hypothetical protein